MTAHKKDNPRNITRQVTMTVEMDKKVAEFGKKNGIIGWSEAIFQLILRGLKSDNQ
jgi:hypothetical protein